MSTLRFGTRPCALGVVLAAVGPRGLRCALLGDDATGCVLELRRRCDGDHLIHDQEGVGEALGALCRAASGTSTRFELDPLGTRFQRRVWAALSMVPRGQSRTYAQIASMIGEGESAARAVGGACAANPIAMLIPCHRALPAGGGMGGFAWGAWRKESLLRAEGWTSALAHREPEPAIVIARRADDAMVVPAT